MNESIDYLHEVFDAFGPIRIRRMFGGWGLFHQGLMFGLYARGQVFLKTDADNVSAFQAHACEAFTYEQKGRQVKLSYYQAPDIIMDERDQAAFWARSAFEAALRSNAKLKISKASKYN